MAGFLRPFADATIASRSATVLTVTVLAGAALLIVTRARPRASSRARSALLARSTLLPAARDGYAYLVVALATRFMIQQHRSRLQILALLVIVAVVEAARLRPGTESRRGATWLAGSAAVCLGVIMAKWALEPGAFTDTWTHLRADAVD